MLERLSPWRALLLGLFVAAAGTGAVVGVFVIGEHNYWGLKQTFDLTAEFPSVAGLEAGSRVRLQGLDAGVVDAVQPPTEPGGPVIVRLRIDEQYRGLIRQDAVATLVTKGVLGNRVVEIAPGSSASPAAEDGMTLISEPAVEWSELLADAREAGRHLQVMGQQVQVILARMDDLTAKVQQGEGSLGQFVMKDQAHQSAVAMMESGDQLMGSLEQIAVAVQKSWLLRDSVQKQGLNNPDDLLFRPGAERTVESLPTSALFEEGRSVLTPAGRARLDNLVTRVREGLADSSEIVVAAFDQDEESDVRAGRLTQEQADAVKSYLVDVHEIDEYGYFGRRTVNAYGFGGSAPSDQKSGALPQRVEVIVFTPEA